MLLTNATSIRDVILFPLLWGLLAFLFNYVPTIGSLIASIPPIVLALVQFGLAQAAVIGIGYLALNVTIGGLIEPRVMGRGLGLSTLVVFLSLVFWGWVFGPIGMLLSVPLTMTAKIALESGERTRFLEARCADAGFGRLLAYERMTLATRCNIDIRVTL